MIDALSDVLRVARLTGGIFLRAEFSAPWCVSSHASPTDCAPFLGDSCHLIPYHYVVDGTLRARLEDGDELVLESGEVVLFPRNDPHLLGSNLALTPIQSATVVKPGLDGRLSTIELGGGGARTRIVCGYLGGSPMDGNPVFRALPSMLRFDAREGASADWIRSTFNYAADEVTVHRAGSNAMLTKLSEMLFIEAVRRHVEALPDGESGWLAGLKDPYVSRALSLLHARLAEPWTVDNLGREVGLSRSALAERFQQLIGHAPMHYLTDWRMRVAAQELVRGDQAMIRVALSVGYESEAAFARAFKRVMKTSPGAYRRQARQVVA